MNQFYYNLSRFINSNSTTIIIPIIIVVLLYLLGSTLSLLIVKLFNMKIKDKKRLKSHPFYIPLRRLFKFLGIYLALLILPLSSLALPYINKGFRIIIILLITSALADSVNLNSGIFKKLHAKLTKDPSDTTLLIFISKTTKIIIYLIAFVIILKEFGYDINGLIAGLGVAGLTVSLAAQDAAKNLFGGVIIILDKPFKKEDWIKTTSLEGIVEEITFRSTRVRTFDDTIVVVPNSTLANIEITNWSKMQKRKVISNIQLEYSASLKQLSNCVSKIEKMLKDHKEINKDVINVYFTEIADSGYNVLVHYFTDSTDYSSYLRIKEDVNYKIIEILNSENVELAYPSQAIYVKK